MKNQWLVIHCSVTRQVLRSLTGEWLLSVRMKWRFMPCCPIESDAEPSLRLSGGCWVISNSPVNNYHIIIIISHCVQTCVFRADRKERGDGASGQAVRWHHHLHDAAAPPDWDTTGMIAVSFSCQSFFPVET